MILGSPAIARADNCTDAPPAGLNGTVVGGECQVNSSVVAQGTYNIPGTLHICSPAGTCAAPTLGTITVPPLAGGNNLTLIIQGKLIMDDGAGIIGDVNTASGIGASLTISATSDVTLFGSGATGARITSDQFAGSCTNGGRSGNITISSGGNVLTQDGSVISSGDFSTITGSGAGPKCPGGEIVITAGHGSIDIDGKVLSQSTNTGGGNKATQRPGGGPITITAGCHLLISDTGIVSSRGLDPGADLVRLQGGCSVVINGLVESTGPGHAIPANPPNHCATGVHSGKPSNSTACVEVVSGGPFTIDSNPAHTGEINADVAQAGGSSGHGWIDIWAVRNIQVLGDSSGPYAIHANEFVSNSDGGTITAKSQLGSFFSSGLAIQANGPSVLGGHGGVVDVEAGGGAGSGAVSFGASSSIQARGSATGGGHQGGGSILAHSWQDQVVGMASASLNASGGPPAGSVTLRGCAGVAYAGSSTPAATTFSGALECGAPTFPGYITFPGCACALPCPTF